MRLPGDRIERVDRLSDQIPSVAPTDLYRPIRRDDALIFPERVALRDQPIVVGRGEVRRVRQRDVRRRQAHRGRRHAQISIAREGRAAIVRVREVEVDGVVCVLRVVADVHVVRIGVDRERRQHVMFGPGFKDP